MLNRLVYFFKNLTRPTFKVGLISYYYPINSKMANNGVAIHTYYLSRELAKKGCEVHIFTRGDKNSNWEEYLGDGKLVFHCISTEVKNSIKDDVIKKRLNYLIFDNRVINEITRENSSRRFDIIHTHGWLTAGAFISKHFNKIKWIHTFHALEKNRLKFMTPEEKRYSNIAQWVESTIHYTDALISVSRTLRDEVGETYDIEDKKSYYVPNGVDLSLFRPEDEVERRRQVLYIGRLSLEKGIDFVAKIASIVLGKDPKVRFVIVSPDSSSMESLEEIKLNINALEERFGERIRWIRNPLSREEIAELYKESMVYIQPSRYEAFGLAPLEAMACGCAVIVSDKGGLPEVVSNTGIILPLNSKRFAKQIINLLNNDNIRNGYSKLGVERAAKFSWEGVADKTLELYQILAKNELHSANTELTLDTAFEQEKKNDNGRNFILL